MDLYGFDGHNHYMKAREQATGWCDKSSRTWSPLPCVRLRLRHSSADSYVPYLLGLPGYIALLHEAPFWKLDVGKSFA